MSTHNICFCGKIRKILMFINEYPRHNVFIENLAPDKRGFSDYIQTCVVGTH